MNEELQQKLATILDAVMNSARNAATWTLEQAPAVAREMVVLGRAKSAIAVLMLAVGTGLTGWLARRMYRRVVEADKRSVDLEGLIFPTAFFAIACVILLIITAVNIYDAATPWLAPRVYLLQETARIIGGAK